MIAEKEYLLEYYSLVREGKTAYVSNAPMLAFFGHRGQEPTDFFKTYSVRIQSLPDTLTMIKVDGTG